VQTGIIFLSYSASRCSCDRCWKQDLAAKKQDHVTETSGSLPSCINVAIGSEKYSDVYIKMSVLRLL
jgi:hypothetical protein